MDLDEHTSAEDADMDVNTEANANADDDFDYLKEIEEIEAQEKLSAVPAGERVLMLFTDSSPTKTTLLWPLFRLS